jgi:hypothetical protein
MIRTKFPNQTTFVDPWDYLGPKRKKRVNESWAGTFRDDILPANTVVNKDVPAKSMAVGILAKHCEKAILKSYIIRRFHMVFRTILIRNTPFREPH